MNRRAFIGSILGTVAGTNFFARLITERPQRIILPYRLAFRDLTNGHLIQAPGVQEIRKIKGGFEFIAEPLHATKVIRPHTVALFTNKGELVKEHRFDYAVNMYAGDIFKCTYQLTCGIDFVTADEMIQAFLAEQRSTNDIPQRKAGIRL